jgi:DNA polymerase I-like protein with 3'-5' exonuclease and polymerase domains
MEYKKDQLKYPDDIQTRNLANFIAIHNRKPTPEEKWLLNHRMPTDKEIKESMQQLHRSIERMGKNHEVQGCNASLAKVALAILWRELPKYSGRLVKFVHDEIVATCPKEHGQAVADLIGKSFLEAGREVLRSVDMLFEFNIGDHWAK